MLVDHLGSTRLVLDATTEAVEIATRYTPYGRQTPTQSSTVTAADKAFLGERQDETGLLYLNARYYDPTTARFVSPDWWEVERDGVGFNR